MGFLRFPRRVWVWGSAWRPFGLPELRYYETVINAQGKNEDNSELLKNVKCVILEFSKLAIRAEYQDQSSHYNTLFYRQEIQLAATKPTSASPCFATQFRSIARHIPGFSFVCNAGYDRASCFQELWWDRYRIITLFRIQNLSVYLKHRAILQLRSVICSVKRFALDFRSLCRISVFFW